MRLTWDNMLDKLRSREPFTLSRFGDGEWSAILGKKGQNCDGHPYTPSLGAALLEVLEKPQRYYLGMHQTDRLKDEILPFCEERGISHEWSPTEMFHTAYVEGRMPEFLDAIRGRRTIFVGPPHVGSGDHFNFWTDTFVEIPEANAWEHNEAVWRRIQSMAFQFLPDIILFAAGMPACVWIDRLHGPDLTIIDIGSALDPFCGVHSRSFHKRHWGQYA